MKKSVVIWFTSCLAVISVVSISWAVEKERYMTPESKAWQEVNSLSKESLQDFLKKFPEGGLAKYARTAIELQDKLAEIKDGKAKADFTISLDVLGEKWKAWQKRMPGKGVVGYHITKIAASWFCPPLSGGKTPGRDTYLVGPTPPTPIISPLDERGIPISPTGDGSIVAFCTSGLKFELFPGLVFETPTAEFIYFAVIEGKGLVHLKGAGNVTLPGGKTTNLK